MAARKLKLSTGRHTHPRVLEDRKLTWRAAHADHGLDDGRRRPAIRRARERRRGLRDLGQFLRLAAYLKLRRERAKRLAEIEEAWNQYGTLAYKLNTMAAQRQLRAKHEAQHGLCFYREQPAWLPERRFGKDITPEGDPGEDHHMNRRRKKTRATREHLIRKADGGTDADLNIVMACAGCNHEQGKTPVET